MKNKIALSELRSYCIWLSFVPALFISRGIGSLISWAHTASGIALELIGLFAVSYGIAYVITGIAIVVVSEW